jgi:hypothetical protein
MSHRSLRGAWLSLPASLLALLPGQAAAQRGFGLSGSVALGQSYDDNVFAVPEARRADLISRVSPRLGLAYQSRRLDLRAQFTRDVENYRRHAELSTLAARQEASVDLDLFPGAGFELAAGVSYAETNSPGEFNVIEGVELVGLELRRSPASRLATTQSVSRRLGARTRAAVEHAYSLDDVEGGVATANRAVAARVERQVGPVDTLRLTYGLHSLAAADVRTTSHAAVLTWAREVTPRAHLELSAGPRWSGGTLAPELAATLRHRFRRGDASLAYVQTETTVIGQPVPVRAAGLSATFTRSLGRNLMLGGGPSRFTALGAGFEATVYGLGLELAWSLNRHLSLAGSHQLSLQHGTTDGRDRGEIVHNTFLLRLVAGSVH